MEDEGTVTKSARRFRPKGELPPVALLRVLKPDAAGDLFAEPMEEASTRMPAAS
jgi:ribonuclease R